MEWINSDFEDFSDLLADEELRETPVDLDTFINDPYYLGKLKIKSISSYQRRIIEAISQIYKLDTLKKIHGEEEAQRIWDSTVHEIVAMCGKGSGKDFSARVAFAYTCYKLHCLRDPIGYFDKAAGTYIDLLNIAVNAEQAQNVFFQPLKNMLSLSPFFVERGFEPRKKELQFYDCPIRIFSGNSEAEAWEGLDLLLVVLDEIAAFKALGNNVPVLTPNGWIKNGDLRVGDYVIGQNGKPTEVVGVYPQGQREVFEVEFEDGATIQCSEDHYWTVREYSDGRRPSIKTLQLADFKSLALKGKYDQKRYAIPVVEPVELSFKGQLPIDPYVMGILLSEGSLIKNAKFSSGDHFIVEEVRNRVNSVSEYGENEYAIPGLCQPLRDLGLLGARSDTKFIPDPYLFASIEDRRLLLQGLMDGDGTPARGQGSYTTVSARLKDDIVELCRGLGGVPMTSEHDSWYKNGDGNKVECQRKWMICPRVPFNPFLLPRKAEKWKPHKRTLWRSIVNVRSLGYEEEMTCIKVANYDGLYVADNYIVTHNTDQAFAKSNVQGAQRLSASAIYRMSKASVMSRFAEVGKCVLLSFPRYQGDFIMQRYEESAGESHVLRIKAKTFEMNPRVTREMLDPEYRRNPVDAKARFECEPPVMVDAFFRDPELVRSCFRGIWEAKEIDEETTVRKLRENDDIIPIDEEGRLKSWFRCEDDHMRFIHVDLGLKRDKAALCMAHSPGTRRTEIEYGVWENLPVVKMDIIHYWEAQPGKEIDFSKIREFIRLLCKKFPVGLVTFDRWQSEDTIQILRKRGINCDKHSIKRTDYDTLATCFYDGRFSGYFHHILVEDELLKLQTLENGKVEHPDGLHDDLAQALAGAVHHASEFADFDQEIEIDILGVDDWEDYETLEAMEEDEIRRDGRRGKEKTSTTYDDSEVEEWDLEVI